MTLSVQTKIGESAAEPTPHIERRFRGVSLIILLIGGVLLICSTAQLAYRLTLPTDGWSYTSGAIGTAAEDTITYNTNLINQPSSLQSGDFVLAVEGHPYAELMSHALTGEPTLVGNWRAGTTVRYLVQRGDTTVALDVPLYHWRVRDVVRLALGNVWLLIHLISAALGLFVFYKRPYDIAARVMFMLHTILLAASISDTLYWGLPEIINPPALLLALVWSNWIYGGLIAPTVLFLALTFPQPKPFILQHPLLVTATVYGTLPLLVLLAGPQPFLGWGWTAVCGLCSLIAVGHTLLTARDAISQRQLRWAGLGFASLAFSILLEATGGFDFYPESVQQLIPLLAPWLQLAFPITLAVAILRYRLFEIDLILSRTLVYGALTICVISLYISLVTYLGTLFHSEDNLISSLIATGIVAVVFQPLRQRLQRAVNRLLFGQRSEPYAVITTLGRQLENVSAPNGVFAAIVETIGQTLKLPYVAITTADEARLLAAFPAGADRSSPSAKLLHLPLNYQNQLVGVLLVAPRYGEERFSDVEYKLLSDLARQTGIAVYAARITADVQRSRERIVLAREEERRRLRRDLHDGLGPHLASQTLTLDVIAKLMRSDSDQAATLLLVVREQMQQAVSDIRDLIYGLRPPVLDDLGLYGAVEEFANRVQQHGMPRVTLHLAPALVPLPAAVEVAAYRIFQEALNNVVKHAQASLCEIRLETKWEDAAKDAYLLLDVIDNGIGIASQRLSGVGLQSMRERSEELGGQLVIEAAAGGGTRIQALLPLTSEKQANDN